MSDITRRLVLVGNPDPVHVGAHLSAAAKSLGFEVAVCDSRKAFDSPRWRSKLSWWFRGHRPSRLRAFGREVLRVCRQFRPHWVLSTGIAPIESWVLEGLGDLGVQRLNFLTDDPWNPAHRSPWHTKLLPRYDCVFSPRWANLDDLRSLGCKEVRYLPFAYSPDVHYPEPPSAGDGSADFDGDLVFAGGADRDRLPYVAAGIQTGSRVVLYGGYWERFPETRAHARGHADPQRLRTATSRAKVALCLVRRANRDGHVMRSFEIPATGACMLAEDTDEHRQLFGEQGEAVVYFRSPEEMAARLRWLLDHDQERHRLAAAARQRIVGGANTYRDRLAAMLGLDRASHSGA